MRFTILILTCLLAFHYTHALEDPVSSAALFVDGFLRGSLAQDIGRVDDCLTDGDKIVADVESIIKDVESGFDLLSLITDIGAILQDIPNSITNCKELPDTVKTTYKGWLKKIKNPITIAQIVFKALSTYKNQLKTDANDFLAQWRGGQYETSGQKLGDIPHVLFDLCAAVTAEETPFGIVQSMINLDN